MYYSVNIDQELKKRMNSKKIKGIIITISAAILFGIYPPAVQQAYKFGTNSTFAILFSTFFRAFALTCFCITTRHSLKIAPGQAALVAGSGFLQAFSVFGILTSLLYIPGPVTMTIIFTHTIMLLFFLAFRGERKLTKVALLTTVSALFGITLVVDVYNNLSSLHVLGIGIAFAAAASTTIRLYFFEKLLNKTHPAQIGAQVFIAVFLFLLLLLFFNDVSLPTSRQGYTWLCTATLALVLGTFGMFYGIALLGSFEFSLLIKIEPVFTSIFSIAFLGTFLAPSQYLGIAIVIASLTSYQLLTRKNLT